MRKHEPQVNSSSGSFRTTVTANAYLAFGFESLSKIVVGLHPQPGLCGSAERFGQTNCHFGTNASALVDQIVQRLPRNSENLCARRYAQSERLKAFLPDDASGVGRVLHRHDFLPFLMIINQLNIKGVSILEPENDPPVRANGDG